MDPRSVLTVTLVCTLAGGVLAGATAEAAPTRSVDKATAPGVQARAAAGVHRVGGCQVFPADNPWNTRIDDKPVAKRSKAIIRKQAAGHEIHLDLGTTEEYYGIPVNVVSKKHDTLPLRFGVEGEDYRRESDRGPVPTPKKAHIEGGSRAHPDPSGGDRHVITVRRGSCKLVELYKAKRVRNSAGKVVAWRASAAARWNLGSNKLRPKFWTSADAAGLPILPGLLDYDEAASGEITHALRFTLPSARAAFVSPARHCGPSGNTSPTLPSYGMRFRLDADFPVKRYHGAARAIVVAMKRYGLMYADQGSSMYVTGSTDPRWAKVLDQFNAHPIDGKRFEVVKTGKITRCR